MTNLAFIGGGGLQPIRRLQRRKVVMGSNFGVWHLNFWYILQLLLLIANYIQGEKTVINERVHHVVDEIIFLSWCPILFEFMGSCK